MLDIKNLLLERGYTLLADFVIFGNPPRKSNQRRLVRNKKTGKPFIIKSKKAIDYLTDFQKQVTGDLKQKWGTLKESLTVVYAVFYRSRRSDLSVELLKDCLEKTDIITNDRYIIEDLAFGFIDKENPRVHITIFLTPPDRNAT